MPSPFETLLAQMRRAVPTLIGEVRTEWGARSPGSRQGIRHAIALAVPKMKDPEILKNMDEPPRPADWSISISHTHNLGGWMALPRPKQVGWDVELKARIKLTTIERVCKRDELDQSPDPAFLWCAKEAYFKALEDEQPVAIPQLVISGWKSAGENIWRWHGFGPRNGEGLLIDAGEWLMAGALIL